MKSKFLLYNALSAVVLVAVSGCSTVTEPSPIASFSTGNAKASSSPGTLAETDADGNSSDISAKLSDQQRNPYQIVTPQCGGAGSSVPNIVVSSEDFTTDPSGSFASKTRKTDDGVETEIINLNGVESQSGQVGASPVYNSGVIKIADIPQGGEKEISVTVLANGQGGSPRQKTVLKDSYQAYEGAQGISPVDYIGRHDFNSDTPGRYEDAAKIKTSGCGSIIWHDNDSVYIVMLGNDYVKLSVSFS